MSIFISASTLTSGIIFLINVTFGAEEKSFSGPGYTQKKVMYLIRCQAMSQ